MPTTTRRQALKILGGGAVGTLAAGLSGCGASAGGGNTIRLRLSHQWPKAKTDTGDFRARLAQRFADQVAKKTEGQVEVQIYPNSSLVAADEQYKAMTQGTIDMTVMPIVYATGQHPVFALTDLPTLIRNHAQAQNWQKAEVGRRLEKIFEQKGTKVLTWNWNSTCMGARRNSPVTSPDQVRQGEVWRGGGPEMERMLQNAGASITSMPSSETYSALQTGVLDALLTSPASFRAYRLHEQTSAYTSPTENTLGFFFEPLLITVEKYEQLPEEMRTAFDEAGKDLQDFAYTASEEDDRVTERAVREAGDSIGTIDDAAFSRWEELARPIWDEFATNVPEGAELLELAKQVPAG